MSASTLLRSTFLIVVLLGSVYLFHVPNTYATACAKYASGSAIPAGYGAAYDLWDVTSGLLLSTDCTTSAFSIKVGNGETTTANFAVYKTGYRWTGSAWQAITFVPDGGEYSNNYILGKAKSESSLSYAGTDTYFVAFTCSLREGTWKCGCRDTGCGQSYWQLQAAVKQVSPATPNGDTAQSPASRLKGLNLLYSFDALWRDLLNRGDTNSTKYYPDTFYIDTRNKCGSSGCTRTFAWFDGRATMKFTTMAGLNYSAASTVDNGQVSNTHGYFTRRTGKSYSELMHTVDLYIPSSANFHIPKNLYSLQDKTRFSGQRCSNGGKGPVGLVAGQVDPLPAQANNNSDGWQFVRTAGRNATAGISGLGSIAFGNRECSSNYNQFKVSSFGFWDPVSDYMQGHSCQKGSMPVLPRDRWITLETYGKLDTNGRNGIFEIYIDGTLACGEYTSNWGGNKGWRFIGFGGVYMWGGAEDWMVARDTTSVYYSNSRVFGK